MTRKSVLLPLIASASQANLTQVIAESASYKRLIVFLNVTVVPGTSLDLSIEHQDPQGLQWMPVQTKFAGKNANGAQTIGDWSLGAFAQVTSGTSVPYTEARALTDTEMFSQQIRLRTTVVGGSPTYGVTVVGETEEAG